jgi:hypothetical protein
VHLGGTGVHGGGILLQAGWLSCRSAACQFSVLAAGIVSNHSLTGMKFLIGRDWTVRADDKPGVPENRGHHAILEPQ